MGTRPCKADPEPLYSVGDKVYTYSRGDRDAVEWTVEDREVTYRNDRLAAARYTLARLDDLGHKETMSDVHPNDIYDTAKEVIMDHFDDMRQVIESDIVEIKHSADTMLRWLNTYFKTEGDNQ